MATQPDRPERTGDGYPVLTGLIALVAVALTVGLIMGGAALAATQVLGVSDDGGGGSEDDPSSGQSMYLPPPEKTEAEEGPLITLAPGRSPTGRTGPGQQPPPSPTRVVPEISLSAAQTDVSQMEPIDLSGTYATGEGAVLQVQQFKDGGWDDFPVSISVKDGIFATYIQASALGVNRFRVRDTESGTLSNEVKVTIE